MLVNSAPIIPSRREFLSSNLGLEDVLEAIFNLLVSLIDFLVDERAILSLISEGIGETLGSGRDAAATIQVEQPKTAQKGAPGCVNLLLHALGWCRFLHDHGDVAERRGEARHWGIRIARGYRREDRLEFELCGQHCSAP